MTNDRCLEREGERDMVGAAILATFLINIFFLVFNVNINHLVPKQEWKILAQKLNCYLGKLSRDRLSGENYQRVSA